MIEIGPSILAADFARLAEALETIERAGADLVHVDVMDGHFVPNLTIGWPVVASLRAATRLPLDCHLMIQDADRWVGKFLDAGAQRVSVHVEACPHLERTIRRIRDAGAAAGVALNPATPIEQLSEILSDIQFVLVMSVNPGFAGQRFIESAVDKTRRLARRIDELGLEVSIHVDGGVSTENIGRLVRAGARGFVAGSAVFSAADPERAVRALRQAAEAAL